MKDENKQSLSILIKVLTGNSIKNLSEKIKESISEGWKVKMVIAVITKKDRSI